MSNKSKLDIIINDDAHIIVRETPIYLPDEKVRSILYRTYERAQHDVKGKLYDYYDCLFSVAITAFIAVNTTSFHDYFGMDAATITRLASITWAAPLIGGILLIVWKLRSKQKDGTLQRDNAVDEVFAKYIKCDFTEFSALR